MWDALAMLLSISWKIFGIMTGWMLIKHLMRDGTGTIKELLETTGVAIRAGCMLAKKKLWTKIREEKEPIEQIEPNGEPVRTEGTVR